MGTQRWTRVFEPRTPHERDVVAQFRLEGERKPVMNSHARVQPDGRRKLIM